MLISGLGVLIILLWLALASLTSSVATGRGRPRGLWFFLGLLLGPLALLVAAVAPRET